MKISILFVILTCILALVICLHEIGIINNNAQSRIQSTGLQHKLLFLRGADAIRGIVQTPIIYSVNSDGSALTSITSHLKVLGDEVKVSPDGRKIAFESPSKDNNWQICVMNSDGSNQIMLTDSGHNDHSAWSANGSRIAFTSTRGGNLDQIFSMNVDGTNQTRLTDTQEQYSNPIWSPRDDKIAYIASTNNGWQICVMNSDGSSKNRFNSLGWTDELAWSPDGLKIAFTSKSGGIKQIYVINVDGTHITKLTSTEGGNYLPAWSPSGNRIAFISESDIGNPQIYIMNSNGSNQTKLTGVSGYRNYYPAWSPDGRKIAFTLWGVYPGIYLINNDGTDSYRLTNNQNDMCPIWLPSTK
jgi:Tol biopolymer transport system component